MSPNREVRSTSYVLHAGQGQLRPLEVWPSPSASHNSPKHQLWLRRSGSADTLHQSPRGVKSWVILGKQHCFRPVMVLGTFCSWVLLLGGLWSGGDQWEIYMYWCSCFLAQNESQYYWLFWLYSIVCCLVARNVFVTLINNCCVQNLIGARVIIVN